MKLTRFQKNYYATLGMLAIMGVIILLLYQNGYVGRKLFYVPLFIVSCLGGYVVYLLREKKKLRQKSKDRKA